MTNFLGKYNNECLDILIFKINTDKILQNNYINNFEIETFYKGNQLKIELSQGIDNNLLSDFIKIYNGSQSLNNEPAILRIKGLKPDFIKENQNGLETLMNSIFFDIKCIKGEYFEVYKYHLLTKRIGDVNCFSKKKLSNNHKLVVKKLIPELVDYLKVAERINYLPFKFLCYYHILEYFLDKSAHLAIKSRITNLLYKSDFELNSDKYIDDILQSFKDEGNKLKSDKLKIQRVLQEFIVKTELLDFVNQLDFKEHFFEDQKLELNESIIELENINVEQDFKFYKLLSDRIYSLRCSIVHSNPDFGKKDAIPFVSSNENLLILEKEIFLFEEIAKNLILKSRK
ncbi:hypothetical protein [Tenacibaculum piscium]|uniref:hypothetical protein n=1 Tax=Tenacibaculum piscium TaxID=1458515 RepID=UPI001EFB5794|nr:hypothetical protein [Tenacibaculum piscium]MCG8184440.1 hypothetical protein [Tenacibaculum piscium]MCG8205839.1 hypothetical protein [Tenacibaculum piscium]